MPVWYMLMKRGPNSPTWKAVEAKVGPLDVSEIAGKLAGVIKEWGVNAVADKEDVAPFLSWLDDYARIVREKGEAVPPELASADPSSYRLIQARQLDSGMLKETWWQKMEDASDNWVLECSVSPWYIQHTFSPYDEFTPGKKYRVFARVKGSEAEKPDGIAFVLGGIGPKNFEAPGSALADGQFHTFQVAEFTPQEPFSMYFIIPRENRAMPKVFLDCLWLEEVR